MTFALLRRLARFCANRNEAGVRRSSSSDRNCDPENGSLVRPVKLHRAAIPVGDDVIRVAHEYRVMREVEQPRLLAQSQVVGLILRSEEGCDPDRRDAQKAPGKAGAIIALMREILGCGDRAPLTSAMLIRGSRCRSCHA